MIIRLLILGLVWLGLAAQPGFGQSLGLEAGANFANLNGKDVNNVVASRLGIVGGGFLYLPLSPSLAFQPEVLYAQKGAKTADGTTTYQLDYVEIPVLLEISLGLPVVALESCWGRPLTPMWRPAASPTWPPRMWGSSGAFKSISTPFF